MMAHHGSYGQATATAADAGPQNFAGFGARRFQMDMEQKKRQLQQAAWEQAEWERREYERIKREEEQAWYRQQQEQARIDEEQHARAAAAVACQQSASSPYQQQESWHGNYSNEHGQGHSDTSAPARQASSSRPSPAKSNKSLGSDHDLNSAYDPNSSRRSEAPTVTKRSTGASTAIGRMAWQSTSSDRASTAPTITHARLTVPSNKTAARETVYDDDYEEADGEFNPAGWNRSSNYSSYGDETADQSIYEGHQPSSQGSSPTKNQEALRINRATVLEPELPKAKCADCGEHLSFEELADHSCLPRGPSSASLLTLNIPSSGSEAGSISPDQSRTPSPAVLTPRSPFFDKYSQMMNEGGSLSPAFTTPQLGSSKSETFPDRPYLDETPKGSANRAADSKSPDPSKADLRSLGGGSAQAMQRSNSDGDREAMERKRIIEQQRAAKKMAGMGAVASTVMATLRVQDLGAKRRERSATDVSRNTKQKADLVALSKQASSSSLSSAASSHLGFTSISNKGQRERQNSGGTSVSTALTPSSSYDQFSDSPASPMVAVASKARVTKAEQVTDLAALKPKTPALSATAAAVKTTKSSGKPKIDLGGIEDLMKGLTVSPKRMSQELPSPVSKSEAPARDPEVARKVQESRQRAKDRAAAAAQAAEQERKDSISRSQSVLEQGQRSAREQELELEIERLKEKERLRELQKTRRREKERQKRVTKRCCVCSCSLSSSREPFVERDGKLLCAKDWKELYLPKCRKCGLAVERGAVKSSDGALKGVFHRACFTCFSCDVPFKDGRFYVYGNQPYCARHYHKLNGSLCKLCGLGVEGDCRQTETGDRYHPTCFRCQYDTKGEFCQEPLSDYYMIEGRRLCEWHAEKVSLALEKQGKNKVDLRAEKRKTMLRSLR